MMKPTPLTNQSDTMKTDTTPTPPEDKSPLTQEERINRILDILQTDLAVTMELLRRFENLAHRVSQLEAGHHKPGDHPPADFHETLSDIGGKIEARLEEIREAIGDIGGESL